VKLNDILVAEGTGASDFLAKNPGRYFLLNITRNGQLDAACLNVTKKGSAACRFLNDDVIAPVSLENPDFQLSPQTLRLSYGIVNTLGNYFETIRSVVPDAAFNKRERTSVGQLTRKSEAMGTLLAALQAKSKDIGSICDALQTNIDTPIYNLRKKTKRPLTLATGSRLSSQGKTLLEAYSVSLPIYACLPELCGFGTENATRGKAKPNKRDARLRHWMHEQQSVQPNPLNSRYALNFVSHELKPLNIAGRNLTWNCSGNPRTDSIDLLLEYEGSPVITEVKMAGDSFLSVATVQLWYYAAVLASESQRNRIGKWFDNFSNNEKPWLGLLAQSRDENKSKERGFSDDLKSVLRFLSDDETKGAMGQQFAGALVLTVEENNGAYAIADGGEQRIDWSG
jgi:hypothetical protein